MKIGLFRHDAMARQAPLFAMFFCLLVIPVPARGDGNVPPTGVQNYCNTPPFTTAGLPANLLLMLDNSASMYDLAYIDKKHCSGALATVCAVDADCTSGQTCVPPQYCLDASYQNGTSYGGYFNQQSIYSYDGSKFVSGATLPAPVCSSASCAASTGYLYLEMAAATPPSATRTVSVFTASGNFLNWLTMSKLDLEKQALTGGKFTFADGTRTAGVLQGETRGCQGKRYVKMTVDAPNVTFAVRGPLSGGSGASSIEVYDGAYNRVPCLAAENAWRNNDREGLIAQTNACQGVPAEQIPSPQTVMPTPEHVFNRVMSDCSFYFITKVIATPDSTLWGDCTAMYTTLFGAVNPTVNWTTIAGMDGGICGNNLTHAPRQTGRTYDTTGFLGKCKDMVGATQDGCLTAELGDYCNSLKNSSVTDPSTTANMAGTTASLPGFVLDAGITNLGNVSGTFNVAVSATAPPTGLVQEFADSINFGAMVFNADGAGTECASGKLPCAKHCSISTALVCTQNSDCSATETCVAGTDGGKVISYINDPASPLGDHGSGLVAAIDAVTATTWTPLAETFYDAIGYFANRTDLRLQSADFDTVNKPAPSQSSCQRNNILIVSDGMSTADSNPVMENLATLYRGTTGSTGKDTANSCPVFEGSRSLDDLAWIAANRNIKTFSTTAASTDTPVTRVQSITTHVIFTGASNGATGECDPAVLLPHTATSGGGVYLAVSDPGKLYAGFKSVLHQIADGGNTGTDDSIFVNGTGNGAIFLQEQFYPTKSFDGGTTAASWLGEMQSLWYWIDPFLGGSNGAGSAIREDTDGDLQLTLKNDRVVQFQDNSATLFYDANGDGNPDGATTTVSPDAVRPLWRAGIALWGRSPADRTIYTPANGTALTLFGSLNAADPATIGLLQAPDASGAQQIISYATGVDSPAYRNRTLTIPAGTVPGVTGGTNVWKLGDIVSSTPKVQSSTPLNSYDLMPPSGYNDASYGSFIGSDDYHGRGGTVYVGANDGMLHAFNTGALTTGVSEGVKASLGGPAADLGKELWAFIPRNALPYLTYLKEPGYRHLYFVDGGITLVDASIGDTNSGVCSRASYWNCPKGSTVVKTGQQDSSQKNRLDPGRNTWRSVLIGGMGLGGASCDTGGSCVPTPTADPLVPANRLGYSSYFALDVTDPAHPSLFWEFNNPALGYATTGPAIIRIGNPTLNGRWFAVFGSGPTGPMDSSTHQFKGQSGQELKFFVVDLRTGELVRTIQTGIFNAFAGSLNGAAIDTDRWKGSYQDDALYAGYNAMVNGAWGGGVIRILTGENIDPNSWIVSKVIDGIGPVTTGIARLQDRKNHNLWLYFGTGRYFFNQDDLTGQRALYGVKEPCYNYSVSGVVARPDTIEPSCVAYQGAGALIDQTTVQHTLAATDPGWGINLDPGGGSLGAERVIVTPTASTGGALFFSTFQPNVDPCLGNSYLWGVKYDTGGAIPSGSMQGQVLTQLSTGRVQQTPLSGGFTGNGNRRSAQMTGSKPGGIKVVTNSGLKPLKKIIHIQER